jgi:rhamnose utilization protein RhaD (predicted bifunctional aldolase and dehydrogenase)/NAD(P)-dependent dehydrogenase (short-subunit alcohol dehydrogenase family)
MKSSWNDADAARCTSPLDFRVYTSRLLGQEESLVLHGGGNTSVKSVEPNLFGEPEEIIWVKGSGWNLATIEAAGFAPVRLAPLRRMAELAALSDAAMVRAQRAAMTDPQAPTPSVEAILHALIPAAFVDHTHADAVVTVSNTADGEQRLREIYGERVLLVPYVMPGFVLARAVHELTRAIDWTRLDGIVLLHHGVFTFGPDARTSYERMIELVTRAERYLEAQAPLQVGDGEPVPLAGREELLELARLRRALGSAAGGPVILSADRSDPSRRFASRPDAAEVATRGPLTPDHVIHTKPVPLVASGGWDEAVARYGDRYRAYFARYAGPSLVALDPAPRWILWPGQGSVAVGRSVREAGIVADITRHTARAIERAERLGGWRALPEPDLFAVEYWELEQAKLRQGGVRPPLTGKVALVTGAASGIGRTVAEALVEAGAAVLATDINPEIETLFARDGLTGAVADATDPAAVAGSVARCVERFGGLDIVVSNAGVFSPSQRIGEIDLKAWDASLALNLTSHLHLMQSAVPFLRLGFDPAIVIIGSKNVPAPGPGAAAYSAAKAGLTQLGRVAALELGKDGIRVNTLHPHLVIDTAVWTPEVLAARAGQYGMTGEQYVRNNLLGTELTTRDVARAVLALVGPDLARTTGAQIPVDGGSDRVV